MQLIEADGKRLLARHGVAVPAGRLLADGDRPVLEGQAMVKAQLFRGGRGKAGLVRRCAAEDVAATAAAIRRDQPGDLALLVEETVEIVQELYAAVRIDDARQVPVLLFSTRGGVDVEAAPEALVRHWIDPLRGLFPHDLVRLLQAAGVAPANLGALARFLAQLYRVFVAEDATLLEINPIALTPEGRLVALDARIELDDAATFRHPDRAALLSARLLPPGRTEREARAAAAGVTYVELPGRIALLTSGAGLGMSVVDQLADHGFAPANFIDSPAGVGLERKIDLVFERARDPDVEAIAVYVLQAAQPLSRAVGRLLAMLESDPPGKPVVVGLVAAAAGERGMTLAEARARLAEHGIATVMEVDELVAALDAALTGETKRSEKR